jgi:predicted ATPase
MITKIHLERFKNFYDADLSLGPFSLLIGVNASGKSNLREAFRFLHGIARGYSIADIIGGKYIGGALQWEGIRGGSQEIAFRHSSDFWLEVTFDLPGDHSSGTYRIDIDLQRMGPRVSGEYLKIDNKFMYSTEPDNLDPQKFYVTLRGTGIDPKKSVVTASTSQPALTQLEEKFKGRNGKATEKIFDRVRETMTAFSAMRFLSLEPAAMRIPSLPGQTILGDRGENLSTTLQAICDDPDRKRDLLEWLKALTPMDASDFEFPIFADGKTLITLIEADGQKITANSASDGTLRFLAMLAILFGPSHEQFFFIEELENGIHPTRLHLLVDLIEKQVRRSDLQIVATTHSPQLLRLVNTANFKNSSIIYRLEEEPDGHIKQIADLPSNLQNVLNKQDTARLFESGWFENMVNFLSEDQPVKGE